MSGIWHFLNSIVAASGAEYKPKCVWGGKGWRTVQQCSIAVRHNIAKKKVEGLGVFLYIYDSELYNASLNYRYDMLLTLA